MILFPDLARMYFFGWDAMVILLGLAGVGMAEQHKRNLILIFIRIIMIIILFLLLLSAKQTCKSKCYAFVRSLVAMLNDDDLVTS